jgi:hypothetical protein
VAISCYFSNQYSCFIKGGRLLTSREGLCLTELEVVKLFVHISRYCSLQSFIKGSYRSTNFQIYSVHINLLKLSGYVMHQQFNVHQLYALPTLYLCVLYVSENKQRLVPLTA